MAKNSIPTERSHFSYTGTELDSMSEARNYHRWILSNFAPFLGGDIIEVGAGTGSFAEHLLRAAPEAELTLLEPAENLFPQLKKRHASNSHVKFLLGSLEEYSGFLSADTVVLVNVLEHVERDQQYLEKIFRILRPGGSLLLYVPALPLLYGSLDVTFGHFRRYRRRELREKISESGFKISVLKYMNFVGFFSWFLSARIIRQKTLYASEVRAFDHWVIPWCSKLEQSWAPPIGQNLLAIARK